MKRFNLSCEVTISAFTLIYAASAEEAIKTAEDRPVCFPGRDENAEQNWIIEEEGGAPKFIRANLTP